MPASRTHSRQQVRLLLLLLMLMSQGVSVFAQAAPLPDPAMIEADLARFEAGLASRPGDVGLHHDAGLACLWLGRFNDAGLYFRAGLAVASSDAELLTLLGRAERKMGSLGESVKALRQAVALRPDRFENWYQLGLALSDLGLRNESIEAFEHALAVNPPPLMVADLRLYIGVLALSNRDGARVDAQTTVLRGIAPDKAETLQRLRSLGEPGIR